MMYDTFEAQKNTKALTYTVLICVLFLLIALLYTWQVKLPPLPITQDLIEVNLGNDHEGLGTIQPLKKGEAAPEIIRTHSRASGAQSISPSNIRADEDKNQEAAQVIKSDKINIPVKNIDPLPNKRKTAMNMPVAVTPPSPPRLKVPLYKGANGTGGNGASEDNGFRNQGYKPGNGDAGSPGGKADAYGNSPGGKSGFSVVRGLSGRRPVHFPSMTDEFNENAKIYVDIIVDANGTVTDAAIARGSTTSNASLRNIAIQKAKQLKFPASANDNESGTILFNFILKN